MRFSTTKAMLCLLLVGFLLASMPVLAQQTSGVITGVVQDGQGAVVPGATITIINQAQGATFRVLESSAEGTFVVTPVPPGTYTVTIEKSGFKKYTRTDVRLAATERVGLPPIALELGSVGESITVEASSVTLQTVSAERSGTITTSQIVDLASSGRSYTDLLKTVAGFNPDTNNANGLRADQNAMQVDGTTNQDVGNNSYTPLRLNTDIIAEFRVITNGQQAEFGRAAGANIIMVTKGGTRDFHGGAYLFLRNEWMNANTWTNNYNKLARARSRNRTQGFNIGGPVYIPGKFNSSKEKLFFFANFEFQRPRVFDALTNKTMPTAEERAGNFAATQENGKLVTIKDPTTGQPFAGNQIPNNRINVYGQQLLNFFPLPNRLGVDNTYNYQYQFAGTDKRNDMNFRGDWNISTNWKAAGRLNLNSRDAYQSAGLNVNNQIGLAPFHAQTGGIGSSGTITTIISPTLTNEFNYGNTRNWLPNVIEQDSKYLRKNSGVTLPLLYPNADPLGQIPNMSFGSEVANAPTMYIGGMPYDNENITQNIVNNVAKVTSKHTLKFGFFYETSFKRQTATIVNNGRINFARDSANPGDSNWDFSNMLLGNYQTFEQSSTYRKGYYRYHTVEWFAQDNWKVLSNLSIDFGVRFSILNPWFDEKQQVSSLRLANYSDSKRVKLYQPTLVNGVRSSLNPLTGQTGLAALIGAIAPNSGDPYNGIVVGGVNGVSKGMIENQGVLIGPRFGIAWSPFGAASKTVVRAGGGVFYERIQGNMIFNQINYPPGIVTPKLYYGNLNDLGSASSTLFPLNVAGLSPEGTIPTVYNYNVSVQRELPLSFLLDVGFVGTQSRHGLARYPFNEAPFGSAWLAGNQDPTKATNLNGDNALPVDFLRPYTGYAGGGTAVAQSGLGGGGFIATYGSSSNYNGMQVALNRRMADLTIGINYTWGKTLGTDTDFQFAGNPVDHRKADYGLLTYDRTQSFVVNYIYNVPKIARDGGALANPVFKAILNDWQISGITSLTSGAPQVVAQSAANSDVGKYSVQGVGATTVNRRTTGSEGWAPRPVLTCNPNKSPGDRTINAFINTSCFAPSGKGSMGMESGVRPFRGPGINNWDLSLFKRIPVGANEARYFQFRLEMYNAFNHTQWSGFNNSPTFDNATGAITNLPSATNRFGFGALNAVGNAGGVRGPRSIQLGLKFYF